MHSIPTPDHHIRAPFAFLLTLVAFFFFSLEAAHAQPAALEGIEEYIESGRQEWGIPGMAVAVVKDDELIYAAGFGVQRLGEDIPVDENTLFGVASTTKAMTATVLGMLVDGGLIDWDDPISRHIPWFRLYDPWVSENVTIRDALTHRTGIGRMTGNRIQFMTHRERDELMYRLRHLEPEQPFREGYVYSNMMYMVAGEVVRAATGTSWDAFIQTRLFAPLGMERSNTSITQIGDGENAAWPHQEIGGEVQPIPRRNFDNVGPSASVNTSAREMAQWMRFNLGRPGEIDGERLVSEAQMREIQRPQVAVPTQGDLVSYGLGWRISIYNGRRILQHSGATDGMNTNLVLVPEENLGVVVMTNTFNAFMTAVANTIIDRVLGDPERDWNVVMTEQTARLRSIAEAGRQAIHDERAEGTSPSHPLEAYTGVYADSLYDAIEVRMEDERLVLHLWDDPTLVADLEHWHYDTFRAVWRNPAQREKFVWFQMDRLGQPAYLNVEFILRPIFLQVGVYPSNYTREVRFERR